MSEHQEPNMEIETLSDDDLDSVSGGAEEDPTNNTGSGTCISSADNPCTNSGSGTCKPPLA
jgi:bacteriocin-like protein